MTDSFKAKTTLDVGAQKYEILSLAALKSSECRSTALLTENPAREPAAL